MHKQNKTIAVLKTFDKNKLNELKEFITCKMFNNKPSLVKLINCYIKFDKKEIDGKFEGYYKKEIGKEFSSSTYKNRLSELNKLVKQFISINSLNSDNLREDYLFLIYLFKNKLNTQFEVEAKKFQTKLNKIQLSYFNFYYQWLFDNLKMMFNTYNSNERFSKKEFVNDEFHSLDKLYYLTRLMQYTKLFAKSNFENKSEKLKYFKQELNEVKTRELNQNKLIHFHLLKLEISNSKSLKTKQMKYTILKQLFFENLQELDKGMAFDFASFLYNNSILFKNDKQFNYIKFEVIQSIAKYELFENFDGLSMHALKTIITVPLKINKIKWADAFLEKFSKKYKIKEDVYSYMKCLIEFEKENYAYIAKKLPNFNFKDMHFKFELNRLELKIFFYENESDLIKALINKFKVAVSRFNMKIEKAEFYKTLNRNFINHFKLLFNQVNTNEKNTYKINKAITQLESENSFEKKWLIKEFNNLMSK